MMPKLSETELSARDAQRDINSELLELIADIKTGEVAKDNPDIPNSVIRGILIADREDIIDEYRFNK